ncbi:S28 family serine protease [Streptomyces sp. NPDC047525]|uniref:S28 family serine protease n=1 Tax=Streptomyces sp. NPDC047525 TaxID=3155264 RepID=UPI0033CD1653
MRDKETGRTKGSRGAKGASALICAGVLAGSAVLAGSVPAAARTPAGATGAQADDFRERLESIPGMTVTGVDDVRGHPRYSLTYAQPVDHRDPGAGTFTQRLTLWHKATDKPTVLFTPGYDLYSEVTPLTDILDANQVSLEHRYFEGSRPTGPAGDDWSKLTVQQEAADEHRLTQALRGVEKGKWIGVGASKGGMAATYHERYYPGDLDGVVAVVAPNDADNKDDRAYERFFRTVGTRECRDALNAVQREMLVRREALLPKFEAEAQREGATFEENLGTADRAYERGVLEQVWGFWQSGGIDKCPTVPDADKATDDELYSWSRKNGMGMFEDEVLGTHGGGPHDRQAATQLGWAELKFDHLDGLLRYPGLRHPDSSLPAAMRGGTYDGRTVADVDRWVRTKGERMLFIYAENDPWSAEKFTPGKHDSYRYVAPGAHHGNAIEKLPPAELAEAVAHVKRWADVK